MGVAGAEGTSLKVRLSLRERTVVLKSLEPNVEAKDGEDSEGVSDGEEEEEEEGEEGDEVD